MRQKILLSIFSFLLFSKLLAQEGSKMVQQENDFGGKSMEVVHAHEDLTSKAKRIIGIPTLNEASAKINSADPADISIPFLENKITARGLRNVAFSGVTINLGHYGSGATDNRRWDLLTTFDESTHGFVQLSLKCQGKRCELPPEVNTVDAEKELASNSEFYEDLGGDCSSISFFQALDSISKSGPTNPLLAKEMKANCLVISDPMMSHRRVWVISLRGIPPILGNRTPHGSAAKEDYVRVVLDAASGEFIRASNTPRLSH